MEGPSGKAVVASTIGAAAGTKMTEFLGDAWGDVLGQGGARAGGHLAGGLLKPASPQSRHKDCRTNWGWFGNLW
jgi:hypothetical protein